MGNFFSNLSPGKDMEMLDPIDLFGQKKKGAQNAYNEQWDDVTKGIDPAYKKAGEQLTTGYNTAMDTARGGFNKARADTTSGYDTASGQLSSGMGTAIDTAKKGYDTAQGRYETTPMVASRQELYQRVLGNGGYDSGTLNSMKSGAREEYGTNARDLGNSLKTYYGDSSASGLAGENLAKGMTQLGEKRASAVRDIDVINAQLKEQQQTDAITSLNTEAYQRAGLDAREADMVSGLQRDLATGQAQLTAQETNMLAGLASQEGMTLADLQAKLASGQASLTTDEAKILAELAAAHATGNLTINAQPNVTI
jgi:hypothetical protein